MELHRSISNYLSNYNSEYSLGSYFRKRRGKLVADLIRKAFERHAKVNVLDIGGRESYWQIFPKSFLGIKSFYSDQSIYRILGIMFSLLSLSRNSPLQNSMYMGKL